MDITKCFATFIDTPKFILCYTAQPEPAATGPKCSHILQSDMKETVVNESATGFFEKKNAPSAKRANGKWIKISNHLSLVPLNPVKNPRRIL